MKLFAGTKVFVEHQYEKEADFEKDVVLNAKRFFGVNSIYIDAKRKIAAKSLGKSIPDGYLFDLSDKGNPEFYIVEVELAKHDFFNHIFPQITKFLGFYKNPHGMNELVEKIHTFLRDDSVLMNEFKKFLGEREVYKFIKDTVESSQNILLIIDGDKKELPEIMETYTDTWGKMVKLTLIKKLTHKNETMFTMHPDFENIEFADIGAGTSALDDSDYNEAYHFEGVSDEVRQIFKGIKTQLVKSDPSLVFNPQKYYISIRKGKNIAYFMTSRKKMRLVVMQSFNETKKQIRHHAVKKLTPGVQEFWNGPSCAILIDSTDHLDEVNTLLRKLIKDPKFKPNA